jgi:hypothetical protein
MKPLTTTELRMCKLAVRRYIAQGLAEGALCGEWNVLLERLTAGVEDANASLRALADVPDGWSIIPTAADEPVDLFAEDGPPPVVADLPDGWEDTEGVPPEPPAPIKRAS